MSRTDDKQATSAAKPKRLSKQERGYALLRAARIDELWDGVKDALSRAKKAAQARDSAGTCEGTDEALRALEELDRMGKQDEGASVDPRAEGER